MERKIRVRRAGHGGGEHDQGPPLGSRRRGVAVSQHVAAAVRHGPPTAIWSSPRRSIGVRTSRSRPRDAEIPPDRYDPKGYQPDMVPFWPSDKPIFLPENMVPEQMKQKPK